MDWSPLAREMQRSALNVPDSSWLHNRLKELKVRIAHDLWVTAKLLGRGVPIQEERTFFPSFPTLQRRNGIP